MAECSPTWEYNTQYIEYDDELCTRDWTYYPIDPPEYFYYLFKEEGFGDDEICKIMTDNRLAVTVIEELEENKKKEKTVLVLQYMDPQRYMKVLDKWGVTYIRELFKNKVGD